MNNKLKISDCLSLPPEAVTQTFAILAKRGVGKTYTGCVMVEEMLNLRHQVVVVDPVGVWWGLRSSADGKSPGYPIVVFGGEHGDVPLEEHAGELVAQAIIENGFSAVLDLSLFRKAAQNRFMLAFAEALYRLNRKPLHLMVDEADEFAPQRPLSGSERLLGAFEDIVRRGRARGLGVTLITQRAAVLNKNVLTQIEVLVVLRTISPQDREAIEAWTEIHGTKEQLKQLSESMASLPIGTAWFWSPGWLDVFQKIRVRSKTTFDSSATPKVGEVAQKPKSLAAVNLEQLGEQIKATAESAKANDPKELKAEVVRLKKEVHRMQSIAKVEPTPAFSDEDRKLIARAAEAYECLNNDVCQFTEIAGKLHVEISKLSKSFVQPLPRALPAIVPERRMSALYNRQPIETQRDTSDGNALSKCERAILISLAQYPSGRMANQLAILSGYSSGSGGFNNALSALRTAEYITRGSPIQITELGLSALGHYEPLPLGMDLAGYWLNGGKLSKCEKAIFSEVINRHPNPVTLAELSEATGYATSSGGFNNSLSKLRTLELIQRGQPIAASQVFFE